MAYSVYLFVLGHLATTTASVQNLLEKVYDVID